MGTAQNAHLEAVGVLSGRGLGSLEARVFSAQVVARKTSAQLPFPKEWSAMPSSFHSPGESGPSLEAQQREDFSQVCMVSRSGARICAEFGGPASKAPLLGGPAGLDIPIRKPWAMGQIETAGPGRYGSTVSAAPLPAVVDESAPGGRATERGPAPPGRSGDPGAASRRSGPGFSREEEGGHFREWRPAKYRFYQDEGVALVVGSWPR